LPAADRERVARAVDAACGSTAAKFVFVAVPASDHYVAFPVAWAGAVALVATGALALVKPELGIGTGFAVDAVLFVLLTLIFDWGPIRVRLVPERVKRIALHSAAHRAYAAHLMSKDDEDNGVMLFVSLAERHLEIVAEREAHAHVPAGTWDRIVAESTATMRNGRVGDGLVEAITACGRALATVFPKAS
jgi:putative membrane protein